MANITAYIILIIAVILGTAANGFAKGAWPTRNDCQSSKFVPDKVNDDPSSLPLGLHVCSKDGFNSNCFKFSVDGNTDDGDAETAVEK